MTLIGKTLAGLGVALVASLPLATVAEARGNDGRTPAAFAEIDADGDGAVTRAELRAFREGRGARRFDAMDADGDGFLTPEEMTTAARTRAEERVRRTIERLDADDDDRISRQEAQAGPDRGRGGRHHGGPGHRGPGWGMFERADADGDGTLDTGEWETLGSRRARD